MNILSYVHIHRLINPTGVGRVIDSLLPAHANCFPSSMHRALVDEKLFGEMHQYLEGYWKSATIITHRHSTTWQQARWIWLDNPLAEHYWKDLDIVYCPAESYVPTKRGKLVCTIHDVSSFEDSLYPDSRTRRFHRLKWEILFKHIAKHADAVVTVSDFSATRIAKFFPDLKKKLHIIHNAPHTIFHSNADSGSCAEVEVITGRSPYIFVPGGLSLRKNAELIINAIPSLLERLPDAKLIIAGSSDSGYVERLNALGGGQVKVLGYVSDTLLNALYQCSTVVWFPSRYEGFGMPLIEAMTAGAPVVASNYTSIPEVVDDAALLCGVDEVPEHIDSLCSIFHSNQVRSELCEKSRKRARLFSWKASAERLESLFQSL